MKLLSCLAVVALSAPAIAGTTSSARLPLTVAPIEYAITFEPDLAKSTFAGHETVTVEVKQPTASIVLHAAEMTIAKAAIRVGKESWPAKVTLDVPSEMATLTVDKPIPAGEATLELTWSARLNDKLRGLYAAESEGRRYAFTQFEATDARRAFPCFDEPAMKARFSITAVVDAQHRAVSNGAILDEKLDAKRGKKTVRFATTPRMSSYLVALAVGPLVEVKGTSKAGKVPIRLYEAPGKEKLASYALETADILLDRLATYFNIPYPYDKLDLVAVPDFAAGAMENVGAIFFREARLVVDPKTASVDSMHEVALILAHEMAHQWFGDLVTMAWWDDLWLNEAFATWAETKVVDGWKPEWQLWLDFEGWKSSAFAVDSLQSTHAIRTPVHSPEEANENFDSITYSKGAGTLRMLETYLGEQPFRKGVTAYLTAHSQGNATAYDLWKALGEASGQPVSEVATSWFEQPGFPLLSVTSSCANGTTRLELTQQRFFADPAEKSTQRWLTPVCARAGATQKCELLRGEHGQMSLATPGCATVPVVNARHAGFYRVRYAPADLTRLGKDALKTLDPSERLGLVSDTWALVLQGATPIAAYLELLVALKGERSRFVVEAMVPGLYYIHDHLLSDADRPAFAAFVEELFRPLATEVGWEPAPKESDERRLLRGSAWGILGHLAHAPDVLSEVARRLPKVLDDPASVDGTLGELIIGLGARFADAATFESLLKHLRAAPTPDRRQTILYALAGVEDPKLVGRVLELSLGPDVKVQDTARLIGRMMHNTKARSLGWAFVTGRFAELKKKAPPWSFEAVVNGTGEFCDEKIGKQAESFFHDPAHHVESSERAIRQAVERNRVCSGTKARETKRLSDWLGKRLPKHAG